MGESHFWSVNRTAHGAGLDSGNRSEFRAGWMDVQYAASRIASALDVQFRGFAVQPPGAAEPGLDGGAAGDLPPVGDEDFAVPPNWPWPDWPPDEEDEEDEEDGGNGGNGGERGWYNPNQWELDDWVVPPFGEWTGPYESGWAPFDEQWLPFDDQWPPFEDSFGPGSGAVLEDGIGPGVVPVGSEPEWDLFAVGSYIGTWGQVIQNLLAQPAKDQCCPVSIRITPRKPRFERNKLLVMELLFPFKVEVTMRDEVMQDGRMCRCSACRIYQLVHARHLYTSRDKKETFGIESAFKKYKPNPFRNNFVKSLDDGLPKGRRSVLETYTIVGASNGIMHKDQATGEARRHFYVHDVGFWLPSEEKGFLKQYGVHMLEEWLARNKDLNPNIIKLRMLRLYSGYTSRGKHKDPRSVWRFSDPKKNKRGVVPAPAQTCVLEYEDKTSITAPRGFRAKLIQYARWMIIVEPASGAVGKSMSRAFEQVKVAQQAANDVGWTMDGTRAHVYEQKGTARGRR